MNKMNGSEVFMAENPGRPGEICLLINAIFYFLNSAFIINNNGNYRLVAKHNGKLLIDRPYKTLRGAKIAFAKLFGGRGWHEDVKPEWSFFYKPDTRWLKEKSSGIRIMVQ